MERNRLGVRSKKKGKAEGRGQQVQERERNKNKNEDNKNKNKSKNKNKNKKQEQKTRTKKQEQKNKEQKNKEQKKWTHHVVEEAKAVGSVGVVPARHEPSGARVVARGSHRAEGVSVLPRHHPARPQETW